jgi:hypothetical protein
LLVPNRFLLNDTEHMIKTAIDDSQAGHNVYIEGRTVRPGLTGNKRGGLNDTVAVFALVIDSDADKGMGWKPNVPVSLTVETSPGNFQFWFFLRAAIAAERAHKLGERIRRAVNSDHDTGNPVQPYRVAFTINYPSPKKIARGRGTVPTRLVEFNPEALWTPEEIEQAFSLPGQPKPDDDGSIAPKLADLPYEDLWGNPYPKTAEPERIAAVLAVIPHNDNDAHSDNYWTEIGQVPGRAYMVQIGHAVKAASNGSAEGAALFDNWRKGAPDYNADTVKKKWEGFHPTQIGFGTLGFYADKAAPGWREEFEAAKSNSEQAPGLAAFHLPPEDGNQSPPKNKLPLIAELGSKLWGPATLNGKEYRFGPDQSKVVDPRKGAWFNFATNEGGFLKDLMKKLETTQTSPNGSWQFHDETPAAQTSWLLKNLLPETGSGLMAGQWGTFKTTAALEISVSVTANIMFAGRFAVKRPGGVGYFAVEGSGGLKSRFDTIAHERGVTGALPFAWRSDCPPLTASDALDQLIRMAKETAEEFKRRFNVPLVLLFIDTMVAAAAYTNAGDDNDVAIAQKVMSVLSQLSQRTGAFVIGIDHFGKVIETGTRGSSYKEGHAETVLALLGDRQVSGAVTNTRFAIRKQRDGISGWEISFTPRDVVIGTDEDGEPITRKVLDWNKSTASSPSGDDAGWSKSLHLLRRILMTILADAGRNVSPFTNSPPARAVELELVRTEFYKQYPADGDDKQKAEVRRKAFTRAVKNAQDKELIMVREINGIQLVWLVAKIDEPII